MLAGTNFSSRTTTADRYADAAIYAVALSVILLGYSFARYVQARSYGVYASLPFFIPMPLFSPFGTFGAVTRTANVGVHTRALFDIAFWGPVTSLDVYKRQLLIKLHDKKSLSAAEVEAVLAGHENLLAELSRKSKK